MDIMKTIEPKSDQQNFDDYLGGPKTVTVKEVKVLNGGEQPVEVHLVEFPGRPFKPGKSMRRVLIQAWGKQSVEWVGRRMTLFGDPTVKWAGQEIGGIRISHLSDIPGVLTVALTVTRGRRAPFVVKPLLGEDAVEQLAGTLQAATTVAELQAAWGLVLDAKLSRDARLIELKDAQKKAIAGVGSGDDPTPTGPEVDPAAPVDGEPV